MQVCFRFLEGAMSLEPLTWQPDIIWYDIQVHYLYLLTSCSLNFQCDYDIPCVDIEWVLLGRHINMLDC